MTLLLIPLLPLISFTVLILFGRRLGKLAPAVSLAALGGSLALSVRLLFLVLDSVRRTEPYLGTSYHASVTWLSLGDHPLRMGFLADPLSVTMCLVVTGIGWLIMLYSTGYMRGDPRYSRFFATLSLFFCAMLTLVLADNFLLLYIGWEGVGLCSYLLISFWFEKPAAANAGKKAFLTTRVGDLGLFGAILLIAKLTGDLSFADLGGKAALLGSWGPVVAVLIFWGAAGKSAQFPLHVWLPDAMEGPTPVSALIHAATMVAAGVYLIARTMPLFLANMQALAVVATIGAVTSLFAATIACTQTDLKRILAYSTLSQLGLMMLGLGTGNGFAGMFHLVTHAWFKALLFLGAGSVIHAVHHQEITRMGGLWKKMPVTAGTFLLASVAMAGIPPFSGYWSKEGILVSISRSLPPGYLAVAMVVSFLTAFYITRAVWLVFFGNKSTGYSESTRYSGSHGSIHESPAVMTVPLLALAVGAAGVGLLGSPWLGHSMQYFLLVPGAIPVPVPWVPGTGGTGHWLEAASVLIASAGIALALVRYGLGRQLLPEGARSSLRPVYRLVAGKYFVDELYEVLLLRPVRWISGKLFGFDSKVVDGAVNGAGQAGLGLSRVKRWMDEHLVDGAVNGAAWSAGQAGGALRLLQTGLVQNYLLVASAGALAIFLLLR